MTNENPSFFYFNSYVIFFRSIYIIYRLRMLLENNGALRRRRSAVLFESECVNCFYEEAD